MKRQITIAIPKHLNSGAPVPDKVRESILSRFLEIFGGFSLIDGQGFWIDRETVYHDENLFLFATGDKKQVSRALEYYNTLKRVLQQESIYLQESPVETHFV